MNQPGDKSIYTVRGAQPRPFPTGRSTRSSWRGSLIVVGVMFGWMIFTFALAVGASPNDPNVEVPVAVGHGVIVTPADGWYTASEAWDAGPDAISLQNSGVYVAFWAVEYDGTNDDLMTEQLGYLQADFDSSQVLPPSPTTVAGDLPGLTVLVMGVSEYWNPENEVVVATSAGTGLVMLVTAPAGQLARMQDDLDTMLETLVMPR
jgi:hypothetical protein